MARRRGVRYEALSLDPVPSELRNAVKKALRVAGALRDETPYTLGEIAARDGYCCGLCSGPVDMGLSGLDELGPTVDHVVSHAARRLRGLPPDDRRLNVQLAHRLCNLRKGG
jgi:5-methylcytosine-specific restriction endonuclease McrA